MRGTTLEIYVGLKSNVYENASAILICYIRGIRIIEDKDKKSFILVCNNTLAGIRTQ